MERRLGTSLTVLAAVVACGLATAPVATAAPTAAAAPTATAASASAAPTATAATARAAFPVPAGGTITGPTPVPAPAFDLAAGDVCAFGVHLQFPVNRQLAYSYTDASGRVVAGYVYGTLTGVVTRTDTGRSVTRDLSGQGLETFGADGSFAITGYGAALIGFHTGDAPSNQLLVLAPQGVARVTIDASGHRTLVFGRGEDLCRTLG